MRTILRFAGLAALLCLAVPTCFAKTPTAAKSGAGAIVIVFKDGHRQSINLADIVRIEFPTSADVVAESGSVNPALPSRNRYLGKWEVGDGEGNNFYITLRENGDAVRSLGDVRGHWDYVEGEARVTWDDGAQDAIRKTGTIYQKFAYRKGKSFTDTPDNVAGARNTNSHPI